MTVDLDELDRLRTEASDDQAVEMPSSLYCRECGDCLSARPPGAYLLALCHAYPAMAAELRELRREVAAPLAFDLQSWLEANLRRCDHGYLHLSCGDCLGWRK